MAYPGEDIEFFCNQISGQKWDNIGRFKPRQRNGSE